MKTSFCLLLLALCFNLSAQAQSLPPATLTTLEGKSFNSKGLDNGGKPMILAFWSFGCASCRNYLHHLADIYDDLQKEFGVKLVALVLNDTSVLSRVNSYIEKSAWSYEVYLDATSAFKKAMKAANVFHVFLLNGSKKIIYQMISYDYSQPEKYINELKEALKTTK